MRKEFMSVFTKFTKELEKKADSQMYIRVDDYRKFDHYEKSGEFAVLTYSKYGDGVAVFYCDTIEAAKIIRTTWGKSIGLEPEPTYKDFALYPTIWEWQAPDYSWSNCEPDAYRRLMGY